MNAIALSCITFVCVSGGALLGMILPGHQLSTEDKDVVRLGTGLIGTIAALVLGLLIAYLLSRQEFAGRRAFEFAAMASFVMGEDGLIRKPRDYSIAVSSRHIFRGQNRMNSRVVVDE